MSKTYRAVFFGRKKGPYAPVSAQCVDVPVPDDINGVKFDTTEDEAALVNLVKAYIHKLYLVAGIVRVKVL